MEEGEERASRVAEERGPRRRAKIACRHEPRAFKKEKKEEKGGKRRGLRLAVAAKLRT